MTTEMTPRSKPIDSSQARIPIPKERCLRNVKEQASNECKSGASSQSDGYNSSCSESGCDTNVCKQQIIEHQVNLRDLAKDSASTPLKKDTVDMLETLSTEKESDRSKECPFLDKEEDQKRDQITVQSSSEESILARESRGGDKELEKEVLVARLCNLEEQIKFMNQTINCLVEALGQKEIVSVRLLKF